MLGIILNTLLLLGFKYLAPTVSLLNLDAAVWLMPWGLSFFTFECIAYLVDVYRGSPASDRLLEFAAYKLFFPKLLSGPITRFHSFTGQLKTFSLPPLSQSVEGLWLIASGAVKKLLIADRIGLLVNLSADSLPRAGSGDIWLLAFAYGLQLYLDFSGYVDVARGSALLLGVNLPQNFNFPYFSTSIADFWRRWHITLGDWLRNYLYFPLGGSRNGLARTCLNLMLIMLIAGIWHGDRWGFIVWGCHPRPRSHRPSPKPLAFRANQALSYFLGQRPGRPSRLGYYNAHRIFQLDLLSPAQPQRCEPSHEPSVWPRRRHSVRAKGLLRIFWLKSSPNCFHAHGPSRNDRIYLRHSARPQTTN